MDIKIGDRECQFNFFLGYVYSGSHKELMEALTWYDVNGYEILNNSNIFLFTPYNSSFDKVFHSYETFLRSKKKWLSDRLIGLIDEFVFLASDFEPTCCGDGRSFYWGDDNSIYMVCDRCGQMYDLYGETIESVECRQLMRKNFVTQFHQDTERLWPYHDEICKLLHGRDR